MITSIKDFDLKSISLIVLAIILVLSIAFKCSSNKELSNIDELHVKNDSLIKENFSLKTKMESSEIKIKFLENSLIGFNKQINSSTNKINKLNKNKNEISNYVDSMSNDSIAIAFTKYLKRRKG